MSPARVIAVRLPMTPPITLPPKSGVSQYKLAIGRAYIHPTRFRSNQTCPYF